VLVNGRRMVAGGTGANAAADLGSIPSAAIERIEVLKDGASAIYGSDAIAGVVNIILRKRYNGTEVGGSAGTSVAQQDGTTYDAHAVTGTAGDKGSMLFSAGYQEQKAVLAGNRDFSKTTYNWDFDQGGFADPNTGALVPKAQSGTGNSSTWPHGRFSIPASACANAAAVASHPALASVCSQSGNAGGGFMQDPTQPGVAAYVPFDNTLYNTNPTNYLITPSRRVQLFSTGDVNLGSEARAFFEASYVNRTSSQSLAPMPLVGTTIPTAPVTISKDSYYNPFGVDIRSWRKRTVEFGECFWKQDLDTFRVVAGFDGSLGEWAGPLSGSPSAGAASRSVAPPWSAAGRGTPRPGVPLPRRGRLGLRSSAPPARRRAGRR
jgi:outer membrane receptor protein involved in Fe transport